ncbi:hypothetical protein DEJ50_15890 [Streptomyces venezuelae]|uniref:Uncharacterized protein n=1 Tax=Streptomyces venezuelae TaxID=54571 RepID=A0A5P2D4H1_STRVZ|nr:hypothetical protein DEJ50_15890 [Streptomyces venezuelae]
MGGAAVLALSGAGQAFAGAGENLDSTGIGTKAWSHGTNGQVAIKDTASDGYSVFTLYDRRNNTGLRLNNSNGNGTTVRSGMDESNYVRKVTACVDLWLTPDTCGNDDRPGDGF